MNKGISAAPKFNQSKYGKILKKEDSKKRQVKKL